MNLARISELNKLISRLNETLNKLQTRVDNLELEVPTAKNAQGRIDAAVAAAKNRVSALASLGLRAEFLDDIFYPVQDKPDCSGIGTTVDNEISGTKNEILETNGQIWSADQEKKQLEMEDAWNSKQGT